MGIFGGDSNGWMAKAQRGDFKGSDRDIAENLGFGNRKAKEKQTAYDQSVQQQRNETQPVLQQMRKFDDTYYDKLSGATDSYKKARDTSFDNYGGQLAQTKAKAQNQATNAQMVYSNTVQPELKNIMETAKGNAGQAMSLAEAGDPNNRVHRAVRDMYEGQAQGVQRQGLADAGVLQSLGYQSAARQFGNAGPLTGGQMQLLAANSQSQAGQAYSNAQRQVANLREQGINKGFEESGRQYDRGQQAIDRYTGAVNNIQSADQSHQSMMGRFRDEIGGYDRQRYDMDQGRASDDYGLSSSLAGMRYGLDTDAANRDLSVINNQHGLTQQSLAGQLAAANAAQSSKTGFLGSLAGAGIGAWAGGAGGAAAGSQLGGAAAQQFSPQGGVYGYEPPTTGRPAYAGPYR